MYGLHERRGPHPATIALERPGGFCYNAPSFPADAPNVTTLARSTRTVLSAFKALRDDGSERIRPGDVCRYLREHGAPMGAWQVRGELTELERAGLAEANPADGYWRLKPD